MDEDKKQKLTKTINESTELSVNERTEWLSMLPLMSDVQMQELEQILTPAFLSNSQGFGSKNPNAGLSHLSNIPKPSAQANITPPKPAASVKPPVQSPPAAPVKPAPIPVKEKKQWQSFKFQDYKEKELPAGKVEKKVELPKPVESKPVPTVAPSPVQAVPLVVEKESILPPTPKAAVVQPAKPQGVIKNIPRPSFNEPVKDSKPVPMPLPQVERRTGFVEPENLRARPLVVPTSVDIRGPQPKAPLNIFQNTETKTVSAPSLNISLETIKDIEGLTPSTFRAIDPDSLADKMAKLVKQNDYYSVKFALEKSVLYQTYIFIGKSILEGKADFSTVQAELSNSGKEYLTQMEFERFTDILAGTQVN